MSQYVFACVSARMKATIPTAVSTAGGGIEKRNWDRSGDAERGADSLAFDPVAFADDDVEGQDQDRLGNPVRLRPSKCHTDRGSASQDEAEDDRDDRCHRRRKVGPVDDLGRAEASA